MGIWQRIKSRVKEWLGGGSSKKATPPRARAIRSVSRGSNQSTEYYRGGRVSVSRDEEERKKKKTQEAFKAKKSETKDITEAVKKPSTNGLKGKALGVKMANDYKSTYEQRTGKKSVVERKQAIDTNRANAQKKLDDLKAKRERKVQKERTYTNADGEKVVVRETKSHRAQGKVGGTLASDTAYRMKEMPKTQSFTRGLASGLSLGATELEAKRLAKNDKDRAEAEKTYQKKKSKGAEMAGEIAGSLATFGGTEGATRVLGEKAVKGGAKFAGKIAPKAAEKTAGKIVKAVGKDRAKKIANAVGADVAQNATTGLIYDLNKATAEHEWGSKEWKKEMKTNAALNLGITGAVAGVSALKGHRRALKEAVENVAETATENKNSKNYLRRRLKDSNMRVKRGGAVADEVAESAPNEYRVSLNRQRKTDVVNPKQTTTIGNGKKSYTWRLSDGYGKEETITVKANKASEAANLAGEYGVSKGMNLSRNVTDAARGAKQGAFGQKLPPKVAGDVDATTRRIERLENNSELYRGDFEQNGNELSRGKYVDSQEELARLYRSIGDEEGAKAAERNIERAANGFETRLNRNGRGEQVARMDLPDNVSNDTSLDVPENAVYNDAVVKGGVGDEARIGNIGESQTSRGSVSRTAEEVSRRGVSDNEAMGRVADVTSDAGRRSGVESVRINPRNRAKLTEGGVVDTHLSDVSDNYATFSNALDDARTANGYGGYVDSQSVEALKKSNAKAYLSQDGYAGVAVKQDGDICGVFKNPASEHKGAVYDLIYTARANGGTKMDCYGQGLVNRYESVGYIPVAKIPFNPKYVSDPKLLAERPDVYVLMKNTDNLGVVASRIRRPEAAGGYHLSTKEELDKLPSFDDYDEALRYRDDLLGKQESELAARANANSRKAAGEFAAVGDGLPSTNPADTAKAEVGADLNERVKELAGNPATGAGADGIKVNKVAEDTAISRDLPIGVRQARSAYNRTNADEVVEGGMLTKWNESWAALNDYAASHATGEKVRRSKVSVSQLNSMDSNAERELRQRLVDNGDLDYEAISSVEMYDKIAKQMRDDPSRWVKDMIDINEGGALDFRSTPEWQARVQYIMGTVDPSADTASEIAYTEAFKLAQNISSKGGQSLNLRRNFVHLTPMGKRDAILDDLINILDKSTGFRKAHPKLNSLGHFDQREYMRKFLTDDDAIRDGVKKLVDASEPDEVSKAFAELMLNVNKKNPKAGFDMLQELRYLNMLGNPKTHIRNILGSGLFSPMRQVSNAIRSGIEDSISKKTGLEVTRHGGLSLTAAKETWAKNPTTEAGKAALDAFNKNKSEILGSAKYETNLYTGRSKTAIGKGIDKLSDFNSNLLSGEDDFFRSRAYRENYIKSYNRYLKDGKPITETVKRRIEKEALEESKIATFNEYSKFASWLNNITRKANDANASTLARWGGRGVNAIMPFTKVPANLMKQSMNYSPIGIAKGFANIKTAAKRGDAELLNRAIDELSSGIAGTGVFGLGMLLGKTTDMFTTNAGKNDPAAKFKKGQGVQNYSITFTDPITGEPHSYTLDWLVPTSATFFAGIEMANQMKSGDFNLFSLGNDWSTVMTRLAEPVMETSMLSGLHGMLETMRGGSDDDDTKSAIGILLRETAQSYMSSLVPTAVGQVSRTAYKTDMQIAGEDDWEYFWNQTKSKLGLANTKILGEELGADTDLYGNVKGDKGNTLLGAIKEGDAKALGKYGASALKNFLSPANIQKVDISEVDKQKLAEYERRVKAGESPEDLAYLFPKKQYNKKFTVGDTDIKMSNRELSAYNQAKATGGEEGMRYALENIMFNRYEKDANGEKRLVDGYTKEEKAKLMKQFKGKSIREVEKWLYDQPQFKNATDAERRKVINGLWTLSTQGKSNASKRVGEQAVYKAQGKDVNEYNFNNELSEKKRKNLEPYIKSGVITYEEAVDFARNAGKTYYTENDEGGSAQTYFNKKQMIEYLVGKGYSYEKAEALFNSFKASNAKPYSGNSLSSGRGRRRYGRRYGGGYHRRSGGGSTKIKAVKKSAFKAKSYKSSYKDIASVLKTRSSSSKSTSSTVKIEPPKVKFKKYEV